MIYKLRRRFILICTISVLAVLLLVFGINLALNISSLNRNMDALADRVSAGGGRFPNIPDDGFAPPPRKEPDFGFITSETPFSTRHFTVLFDENGNISKLYTESIYSITDEQAVAFARQIISGNQQRGWYSNYRYKVFNNGFGQGVVFVDGSMNRSAMMQSMMISAIVLFACGGMVLILILLLSKRAVKPIAESYEKQKQFITDASHELKTPLTLILANLDIAEGELGENEWLGDIRSEGQRMTELVNQLVVLSRMDEEQHELTLSDVPIGRMVSETISEFEPLAASRGKTLTVNVDTELYYRGDEQLLRRLVGVLMDNAIKYCDSGGQIAVTLHRHRNIILTVENTYSAVEELELDRLFDRFYRADRARTFKGGYGIGLSMAKAITDKHRSEITAYKKDSSHIGFKVILHS